MADFYLDVSSVGNEYQAYADTPTTWGVPQDGNGKAGPGHSAAVAIATVDVAGCTASGTGTIGVFGVNVSTTLNASGSALATAIAAAVNAATGAVTSTYSALLLPINRLVYARVNPSIGTQVQIMLRIAGTDWVGFSPTQANISPAATISNFAGGANGPFGYWWNVGGAVFGKAGGINTTPLYGVAGRKPGSVTDPTGEDPIFVRTRRGGADLTIVHSSNLSGQVWPLSQDAARCFVFDSDGSTWAGDAGQFYVSTTSTTGSTTPAIGVASPLQMLAKTYEGFRWRHFGSSNGGLPLPSLGSAATGNFQFENVYFEDDPAAGNTTTNWSVASASNSGYAAITYTNCHIYAKGARNLFGSNGNNGPQIRRYIRTHFEYSGAVSGVVSNSGSSNVAMCEFSGCKFTDRNGIANPVLTNPLSLTGAGANTRVIFDQCTGVAAFSSNLTANLAAKNRVFAWTNTTADREWRIEDGLTINEWRVGANIPTLNSLLPSGTAWAVKSLIRDSTYSFDVNRVMRISSYYRDESAAKTVTLELMTSTAAPWNKSQMFIELSYEDVNGIVRNETSQVPYASMMQSGAANLASSEASWTMNGASGLSATKIAITTAYSIKQNSEVVGVLLCQGRPPGNADSLVIISPQLDFS